MHDAFPIPLDQEAADRMASQAAAQAVQTLIGMLRVARGLIEGRRIVDLSGLDSAVGILCAQVLDLPPDAARALLPALRDALGQLDRLNEILQSPPAEWTTAGPMP